MNFLTNFKWVFYFFSKLYLINFKPTPINLKLFKNGFQKNPAAIIFESIIGFFTIPHQETA